MDDVKVGFCQAKLTRSEINLFHLTLDFSEVPLHTFEAEDKRKTKRERLIFQNGFMEFRRSSLVSAKAFSGQSSASLKD